MISILENWDITAIKTTFFRTRFLKTPFKSSFTWGKASRRKINRIFLFRINRTHWHSLLLTPPGIWNRSTATRETKLIMHLNQWNISHLNDFRDADSRAGRSLTNSWWFNSFCTKLMLPCILTAFLRDTIFSQHDFRSAITRPASTPIAPQRSNLELCRRASAAVRAVFSMLIPVSEKKFLCVNRRWRTKSCTHATAPFTY